MGLPKMGRASQRIKEVRKKKDAKLAGTKIFHVETAN
jgi:hypothetical protein